MYKIIELIINMNGYFKGEIQIKNYLSVERQSYHINQYPFKGKYNIFQDEVGITDLEIVDEDSNYLDIPLGFKIELKEEIKKYHGK